MAVKALFKFDKQLKKLVEDGAVVIDTTSNTHPTWSELSPFILKGSPARNFENLWQYSKVYSEHWDANALKPTPEWWHWRAGGFNNERAVRYPMGKGAIPIGSWWDNMLLGYIHARREIYLPEYAKNVVLTQSFRSLVDVKVRCDINKRLLILLDYDAYDHKAQGVSLADVVNNPDKKCGHAFVLLGLLTGESMI